ncbi:hypothetical protein ACNQ6O_07090 [Marinobacter sp. SBS5]|uniref:hypothetical protein n=1 Tax=Marinobacter sp. SBS5 TaxID=3401754 RepID=UPI003AAF3426
MNSKISIDSQCIFIEKDIDTAEFVDYIYTSELRGPDPRSKSRTMKIGQVNGIFRITKTNLEVKLLRGMEWDPNNRCYLAARAKILKLYSSSNEFAEKAAFQSG